MSFWTELASTSFHLGWRDAGGVRTRYLDTGHGARTLVCLHGVGGHLESFIHNVSAHASACRVIAVDMLGHGYTEKPDGNYEIDDYVRHVMAFVDSLELDSFCLLGTSLGGWVATRVAATFPKRVERLTLAGTAGLTASPRVMDQIRSLTGKAAAEGADRESVRARLQWVIQDPSLVTDEFVESRWQIYSQPSYRRIMPSLMRLQDPTVRQRNLLRMDELKRIVAPTLVVWTRHDPTGSIEDGLRYRDAIPGARFVLFDHSSHLPQYEEATRFNELNLRFLADPESLARDEFQPPK